MELVNPIIYKYEKILYRKNRDLIQFSTINEIETKRFISRLVIQQLANLFLNTDINDIYNFNIIKIGNDYSPQIVVSNYGGINFKNNTQVIKTIEWLEKNNPEILNWYFA